MKDVTLEQLEILERTWPVVQNTRAVRCHLLKQFLKAMLNEAAGQWEIGITSRPKENRQFLSEEAVKDLREIAHRMGPSYELIFSLGVDNSLRRGDIARITKEEAKELLWNGQAVITCKGRHGGKRRLLVMSKVTRESSEGMAGGKGETGKKVQSRPRAAHAVGAEGQAAQHERRDDSLKGQEDRQGGRDQCGLSRPEGDVRESSLSCGDGHRDDSGDDGARIAEPNVPKLYRGQSDGYAKGPGQALGMKSLSTFSRSAKNVSLPSFPDGLNNDITLSSFMVRALCQPS